MFVFSMKLSKLLKRALLCIVFFVAVFYVCNFAYSLVVPENKKDNVDVSTDIKQNNDDKLKFLKEKNIDVNDEPIQVIEVMVPNDMNDEYKEYNEIQKKQGFDLSKYKGKKLKQWTYSIKNDKNSFVTILQDKDKIVGCHILDNNNNKITIEEFLNKKS